MKTTGKRRPKYELNLPLTCLAGVVLTLLATLLCLWVQPNSLRAVLAEFRSQPVLLLLNCLPIGLLIALFAFLYRNVFTATALVGACWGVLSLANRIKLEVRDEPVFPRDLGLLKEVGSAMGDYHIRWPWAVIAAIVGFTVVMVLLGRLFGCKASSLSNSWSWLLRILGMAASLGVLIGLILTVYASGTLYDAASEANGYYIPGVFNQIGFPYCFCHNFTTYAVEKPEGFDKSEAERWETGDAAGAGTPVHVVMVMNEAFSDLTDNEVFTYSASDDPLSNLHAVQNSAHCISGHVVVPGFAGGTANTEFDVLTGMQTNALSSTPDTSSFRTFNHNLDSLFRVFAADGYHTLFLHPGDAWFYNRENVYRWLGADEILFAKDMTDLQYKGRWVTDDYVAGLIEDKFQSAVDAGQLLFDYNVTIQNHMSYTADKYGDDYSFPPVETSAELSPEAQTLLEVYIEGIRDADAMLGRLTSFFSATGEPVVLVFWGDHLPYLGDNQLAYRELGLSTGQAESGADFLASYETPYVIWANDAAAKALDWDTAVASLDLPETGNISACYLGATVLELTGRGGESPWFQALTQARRQLPVMQKGTYQLPDGTCVPSDALTKEQRALVNQLRCWTYYKLKYKEVA